jgi:hypothetical protein
MWDELPEVAASRHFAFPRRWEVRGESAPEMGSAVDML